jgi:tumor protein p53-inducible protein 3
MLAITFKNAGGPEELALTHVQTPTPNPTQLLIRVKATALNRADLLQRRGKYSPPPGESDILGLEIAGEVAARGCDVTRFNIGDRVFGLVGSGGYAEYCLIDHETAMPIPESFSFVEAAAVPEAFLTANEAIFTLGNLQPHETILIHAGASGVGTAGIQLAHHIGATVLSTVSTSAKKACVLTLGAKAAIDYKQEDFVVELKKLTHNQGVNVIIDFIGASYLPRNLQSLQPSGRLICVGLMGGTKAEINLESIIMQRLQIKGLIMRTRSLEDKRAMAQNFCQRWLPLLAERKIQPIIDSIYPFSDVQKAHQKMEENANIGKIVLEVS